MGKTSAPQSLLCASQPAYPGEEHLRPVLGGLGLVHAKEHHHQRVLVLFPRSPGELAAVTLLVLAEREVFVKVQVGADQETWLLQLVREEAVEVSVAVCLGLQVGGGHRGWAVRDEISVGGHGQRSASRKREPTVWSEMKCLSKELGAN